jgi:hypothetical protein
MPIQGRFCVESLSREKAVDARQGAAPRGLRPTEGYCTSNVSVAQFDA